MQRDIKRLVGDDLRKDCMKLTRLIYRANVSRQADVKAQRIEDLREEVQCVELSLRLSKDMGWLPLKQYSALIQLTQSVGKQSTGWMKSTSNSRAG